MDDNGRLWTVVALPGNVVILPRGDDVVLQLLDVLLGGPRVVREAFEGHFLPGGQLGDLFVHLGVVDGHAAEQGERLHRAFVLRRERFILHLEASVSQSSVH